MASETTTEQSFMLAPAERRTSVELLDEVAALEQSVGFPLLERHWMASDDSSSERSASPVDLSLLTANGQPLDESQHPVLRSWSPFSKSKKMASVSSNIQTTPEL